MYYSLGAGQILRRLFTARVLYLRAFVPFSFTHPTQTTPASTVASLIAAHGSCVHTYNNCIFSIVGYVMSCSLKRSVPDND